MLKIIFTIILIVFIGISVNQAYAQEIGLATFQESAQVIIDNKISQETANMSEIYATFEKVKVYFDTKLKTNNDEAILTQWKATNEQFIDLLAKTLAELTHKDETYYRAKEDYDYVSDMLINQATEYAMSLFRIGHYLNACDVFDSLLCNPVMFQNPKV